MNQIRSLKETDLWSHHDEAFREPIESITYTQASHKIAPQLFECEIRGQWWETLHDNNITLLVTREYEHFLLSLAADVNARPLISMMSMPHPSGLAVDRSRGVVYVASTRNPNQIYDLMPSQKLLPRLDIQRVNIDDKPLIPIRIRILPGCLYLHDLAVIDGDLYANAVGQNAICRFLSSGSYERVWWPKCIETSGRPIFGQNHLQLNSIAAGESLTTSFFSASIDKVIALRPGDPDFPVDRRGVIFSGASREVIARGLTRPHSVRLHKGRLWVDNSGYGEVGIIEDGKFWSVVRLPGWTRGLCFYENVMFVGTSRVLPRFRQYAPGLDVDASVCGLHVLDIESGEILGSISWPYGNQIFATEWVPTNFTKGFPFCPTGDLSETRERLLFYAFQPPYLQED
jgi:uncharacterized protein (TIGR03032 family)